MKHLLLTFLCLSAIVMICMSQHAYDPNQLAGYDVLAPVAGYEDYFTDIDGGIIVPDRKDKKIYIFKGGTSASERDWDKASNLLWTLDLKNPVGLSGSERTKFISHWDANGNVLNDVKRIIYKGKVHIIITGNGSNFIGMFEYPSRKVAYWSDAPGSNHDLEYIPDPDGGAGYIVTANPRNNDKIIELYDMTKNNEGPIFKITHSGIHSVHWDPINNCLWAWGGSQNALKSYRLDKSGSSPKLKVIITYPVDENDFFVGTGHGGAPQVILKPDGTLKRYLIFAGKDGILRFDTDTHEWENFYIAAEGISKASNPKGLSWNGNTGEVIFTKSQNIVYSLKVEGQNRILEKASGNAEIYKARWWQHNYFSYPIPIEGQGDIVETTPVDSAYYNFSDVGFSQGIMDQWSDNHLINSGATQLNDGTQSVASFDGINDVMTSPAGLLKLNSANLTTEAWVNMNTDLGSTQRIVTLDPSGAFFFRIAPTGKLQVTIKADLDVSTFKSYNSSVVVPANEWVHLAASVTSSSIKLYINGTLDSEHSLTAPIDYEGTSSDFLISIGSTGATPEGMIDEVKIYNRALSASEIEASFTSYSIINSTDEVYENLELSLYPNPASDQLFIEVPFTDNGALEVSLLNSFGQEILSTTMNGSSGKLNLSEHNIPNGTYLLRVQGQKHLVTSTLLINTLTTH